MVSGISVVWALASTVGLVVVVRRLKALKPTEPENPPAATLPDPTAPLPNVEAAESSAADELPQPSAPRPLALENSSNKKEAAKVAPRLLAAETAIFRETFGNPFLEPDAAWSD